MFYTWGRHQESLFDAANHSKLSHIITRSPDGTPPLPSKTDTDDNKFELEPIHSRSGPSGVKVLLGDHPQSRIPKTGGPSPTSDDEEPDFVPDESLFLTLPAPNSTSSAAPTHLPLPRISTMALFHKTSSGRGVPHAFSQFLLRWPALPRIVIFLSTQVVGLPHVGLEDRYEIVKVRSLQGFYAVNVRLGYRDARPRYSEEILERLKGIEASWDRKGAERNVREIEEAARNVTHM